MTNKKNKLAKKKAGISAATKDQPNGKDDSETSTATQSSMQSATEKSSPASPITSTSPEPEPQVEEEPAVRAEKFKEQGNNSFRAKRYGEAIDLYTKAIDLAPSEPAYLTNRAASYIALKRFRSALADCQHAATLQAPSPPPKTLLRLARCHLALGSPSPALSAIRAIPPGDPSAADLEKRVLALEAHLRNFETARARRDWGLARLALDRCLQSIEGEGGEIPEAWRLWRVELELARANWDAANIAANDAMRLQQNSPDVLTLRGLVMFLCAKLPQALQHVQSALRLDPGHEPAQLLRRRVKDVERLKEEGNLAFKSGQLQKAVDKYREALERIGEREEEGKGGQIRATLLSNRATTLLKLNQHDAALADTEASLLLLPTSFKALRTRARIRLHLEKYEGAVADFKSAIEQAGMEGNDADVRALRGELKRAEADLKRSKTKDYYKILGVAKDCTELDIKKAYRRESLKHHPDKGGDEEKFKLVVEAHAVLSDPRRRERYDLGEDEDGMDSGGGGGGGAPGFNGMSHMDLADLLSQFQGGGGGFGQNGGFRDRGHTHGFPF